jgi:deazaflavin-dependent oxidoreductase (nitroreductase family)
VPTTAGARIARKVARAPVGLFRAGYGWLFGERLLMLQHTGRRSGQPRLVVLEVVIHPSRDRYVVAAGRGEATDWYRNVRRAPRVRVWVGRMRAAPGSARPLDPDEARTHLMAYRARHPRTWQALTPVISRLIRRPGLTDEELFTTVPLVELVLDES